jgi:hypothetical protein
MRFRLVLLLSVVAVTGALGAMPASATAPARSTFTFSSPGVIDCGSFDDNFIDFFDGRETDFFDGAGDLVRIVFSIEHHSNDVNSVTRLTIHEHGHFTVTVDIASGTATITGNQEIANRPGSGVVVQDVGRVVFDADGNIVFFAGGLRASELFLGDQVLCDALA